MYHVCLPKEGRENNVVEQLHLAFQVTLLGRQSKIMTTAEIGLALDLSVRLLNQSLVKGRIKTHRMEKCKYR